MTTLTASEASDLFRAAPERYIDVGHGEVACRSVGQGPAVLFVHGWPACGATFRGMLPHLTPHLTCHVIDLVGSGQSRFDRSTHISIAQHIKSIRLVIDALDVQELAVVGHDSGGMMARHAVAGDPRLRAMGLINTEQPQGLNWRFRHFLAMSKVPGFTTMLGWAAMQRSFRKNPFLLGDSFHDRSLLDGEFEEFILAPLRDDPERLWAAGELIHSWDNRFIEELAQVHAKINVPVALVWGEDDPFFPIEWARQMVSTFSNAQLHVIPEAKLFSHEEKPKEVAQALLPTLR